MGTILQSEIFFFISSIGFIVLFILLSIMLWYIIKSFRTFERILKKAESDISLMGDSAKAMMEDIRDSTAYRLLIGKKKRPKKE